MLILCAVAPIGRCAVQTDYSWTMRAGSDMIRHQCPKCGAELFSEQKDAGLRHTCHSCGNVTFVPATTETGLGIDTDKLAANYVSGCQYSSKNTMKMLIYVGSVLVMILFFMAMQMPSPSSGAVVNDAELNFGDIPLGPSTKPSSKP